MMRRVRSGNLKLTDAAVMLGLSYRHAKRLWRRYREVGGKGLKHGNAGRRSNRSKPRKFRRLILSLIRTKYSGSKEERFGPTLVAEHLAEEDDIRVDHDTVRLWMLEEGLWSRRRKRKKHCQRRERRAHFSELVQIDVSKALEMAKCSATTRLGTHLNLAPQRAVKIHRRRPRVSARC